MANEKQLEILMQGAEAWNRYRAERGQERLDLSGADLRRANLVGANLSDVDLRRAELRHSRLGLADFSGSFLFNAHFRDADLNGANFRDVGLWETILGDVDLTNVAGLEECIHYGPSIVDHRTIKRSRDVPVAFWRGCGLPDNLIESSSPLPHQEIEFHSCFISYSSKDQEFAERLNSDLQNNGVRCWFAPHDLPIGSKIIDGLDKAIRTRDKVLLILSEDAIASDWVEDEVVTAFEEERRRNETMLFPIRLDDFVMKTDEAWASKLRARNIGDFIKWRQHDRYNIAFRRMLKDLTRNQ